MNRMTVPLLAVISGVLLGCSYPPIGFGFLAYAALVPLLMLMNRLTVKRYFFWTVLAGLIFHGITLSWLRHITWPGMIAAILVLSVIFALPFLLARCIHTSHPGRAFFILPFAVAGIEWARSFDVLAFPWMIIGNSQTYYPFLVQFADITSVFGVSFWVAAVNILLLLVIRKRSIARFSALAAIFIIPHVYSIYVISHVEESGERLTVACIQGNVFPEDKWATGNELWNIDLYCNMSIDSAEYNPDVIIWPETATPVYLCETPTYRRKVQSLVDSIGIPVITGTPAINWKTGEKWNAACVFTPGSSTIPQYRKIHLVPFGEAIPGRSIFPALENLHLGQANWDNGTEYTVFDTTLLPPFNVAICFESIFPDLVRTFVKKGSQFLVVVTNDVWFGPWSSPIQHAMISVMRAIEFHLPVVRSANTGISMVVDRCGRITANTETFERKILIGSIRPSDDLTFFARYGNIFSKMCFVITVAACILQCMPVIVNFFGEKSRG